MTKKKNAPVLPYAGTSGWSGSEASKQRAEEQDADGTTSSRQILVLSILDSRGAQGMTWHEMADYTGWHHGQASGMLSGLHKAGKICRLTETRDRCSVYVLPEHVNGRETAAHGRRGNSGKSLAEENKELRAQLAKVQELVKPKFRSYSYTREHLLEDLQRVVL